MPLVTPLETLLAKLFGMLVNPLNKPEDGMPPVKLLNILLGDFPPVNPLTPFDAPGMKFLATFDTPLTIPLSGPPLDPPKRPVKLSSGDEFPNKPGCGAAFTVMAINKTNAITNFIMNSTN